MKDTKQNILTFWFHDIPPSQWFQKNEEFDRQLSERFFADYLLARDGVYDGWMEDAQGCLALCILLDQFPRNMFRETAQAFETDAKALLIAKHAVAKGYDKMLEAIRRRFIYLPYEHSEHLNDQKTAVTLFETTRKEDPLGYDYALRHLEVIEKFGRFPHRNQALSRDSTPEEQAYLRAGGGF
ncbi:MAG: DUF924 domain-containing protein [Rhodospirillales bacterium]|nr:DUF924 domain-containing protein [Rhodospirillales bacterium]